MVRDKDRIVATFLTMVVPNHQQGEQIRLLVCYSGNINCVTHARNFIGFTDLVRRECDQPASWRPQAGQRMEPKKYYKLLEFRWAL
jgi:hypothetical protein